MSRDPQGGRGVGNRRKGTESPRLCLRTGGRSWEPQMLLEWGDTRAAAAANLSWHSCSPPWCPAPHSWGGYSVPARCWAENQHLA